MGSSQCSPFPEDDVNASSQQRAFREMKAALATEIVAALENGDGILVAANIAILAVSWVVAPKIGVSLPEFNNCVQEGSWDKLEKKFEELSDAEANEIYAGLLPGPNRFR